MLMLLPCHSQPCLSSTFYACYDVEVFIDADAEARQAHIYTIVCRQWREVKSDAAVTPTSIHVTLPARRY